MPRALYSGSFDPVTRGHLDIIERAARVFDDLEVVVGNNPAKRYVFTLDERVGFLRQALQNPRINVTSIENRLIADYAYEAGISTIVKGVRGIQDYDYERMMHEVNITQQRGIDTHILLARRELAHISSSAVKELCRYQGFTHTYVVPCVKEALERRLNRQMIVGLTGGIAAGKSHLARSLIAAGRAVGIAVHDIDLDSISHDILLERDEPAYRQLRAEICRAFGLPEIKRKILGELIFNDPSKLERLNRMMRVPLLTRMRSAMAGISGLVLLDTALLVEAELLELCNNNVIVVDAAPEERVERLKARGLSQRQIERRLSSQLVAPEKIARIQRSIQRERWGRCQVVKSPVDDTQLVSLVEMWQPERER
jgi:pantetheine-phosphate adenylyltransferase